MAVLTVYEVSLGDPSEMLFPGVSAGGDEFANPDGRTHVRINNTSGAQITVTVVGQAACSLGTVHDEVYTIPDGNLVAFGPFPPERFNNSNGRVELTYSASAGVTVAAVRTK